MTNRQHYRCADGLPQPEKSAGLREAAADVSTMIEMTTRCSGELPLPLLRSHCLCSYRLSAHRRR